METSEMLDVGPIPGLNNICFWCFLRSFKVDDSQMTSFTAMIECVIFGQFLIPQTHVLLTLNTQGDF